METKEGVLTPEPPKPCDEDAHVWVEKDPGKDAQGGIDEQDNISKDLSGKPSRAGQKRGADFEKTAIINNREKLPVEKCGAVFKCMAAGCTKEQEVDIVGGGRVAEAKSRNAKQVKNRSSQCKRLKSIQAQCFDASKPPLAKLDGSLSDSAASAEIYRRRGFAVEQLLP